MICSKDDSGKTCPDCTCMFNPVVVIATHQRKEITTKNIKLLKEQTDVPKVIIVCSLQEELEYYKQFQVTVILSENKPLGKKWQSGVNVANKLGANPLIILGSDDILSSGFIKMVLNKLKQGFEFVGCTAWFSLDVKANKIYSSRYINRNEDYPIGSGKVYTKSLLDRIGWKVFDQKADRKLDDQGQRLISGCKYYLYKEPHILAVKGGWNELNPIQSYLNAPNIKNEVTDMKVLQKFGYV